MIITITTINYILQLLGFKEKEREAVRPRGPFIRPLKPASFTRSPFPLSALSLGFKGQIIGDREPLLPSQPFIRSGQGKPI